MRFNAKGVFYVVLCAVFMLALSSAARAQTFSQSGSMVTPRYGQTATLLPNGLVLLAGGADSSGNLVSAAELYNPATGAFTGTGSLSTARSSHTATLLNNGRVLIAGGYTTNYSVIASAELYNPATGTFTATGNLNTARYLHTATLLANGSVLIAGGGDASGNPLASAELYNPTTGAFTYAANLNTGRSYHTAALLDNGQVLIAGGADINWNILASAELYDPVANTFTPTGSLNTGRYTHTATLLNSGQVLIAGGYDANYNTLSSAELFNPSTGAFTATGSLQSGRGSPAATLLNNGQVLFAGGTDQGSNVADAELYDPVAGSFSATGSPTNARYLQTATLLTNGSILQAGGADANLNTFAASELYQPATLTPPGLVSIALSPANPSISVGTSQTFTATGTFSDNTTQILASATWTSSDGTIATVTSDATNYGAAFALAPGSATITACTGALCASTTLTAQSILPSIAAVVSPQPNSAGWNNSPVTVSFICTPGAAPITSCTPPVTLSAEGASQAVTGTAVDTSSNTATATATVNLDLTPPTLSITSPSNGATVGSNSLNVSGTISDALSGVGTVTCNGQQATISGSNFSCALTISSAVNPISVTGSDLAGNETTSTISVYLVIPGGLVATGNATTGRQGHTATLLTNGMVLLAGGTNSHFATQAGADLYDPSTGTFTATGAMNFPRISHTATLLNDGTVLITGGYDSNNVPLNTAELYNLATGAFTATGSMSTGRASQTATLLNDGTVLIAGGYDANSNALASAELYDPGTGTFSGVGTLTAGRVLHTATRLNNGRVLIAGGLDSNYNALNTAELYDPSSRSFTATGALNAARGSHTATLLNSGLVLIAGGQDTYSNAQSGAELYDPAAGTFATTGSMATARLADTATLLTNGTVLVTGGTDNNCDAFSSVEIYDPTAGTFTPSGNLNYSRLSHTATLLTNGATLIAGGFAQHFARIVCAISMPVTDEVYNPVSLTPPGLASISLAPSGPSLGAGAAQQFTATGAFSDNSTEVLSSVTWISSDNTVASVTNDSTNRGVAFGVTAGSAAVSACAGAICGSTTLTVNPPTLAIDSLSPSAGDIGAPVIVGGIGFGASQGTSAVAFNGTLATIGIWTPTAIATSVPSGATSGNVVVSVGGANSNGVPFTVSAGPVITGLSPAAGFAAATVTIGGANFGATQGTSTVSFNGLPAVVSTWTATSITATVPSNATTGNIVVDVSGVPSNGVLFTVPAVAQVSPNSGPVGELVTIEGSGFGATQGSGTVSINGTPMQVVSWTGNVIQAAVASGATSGPVSVQQGPFTIPGPNFTIGGSLPYMISPQSISLLVGQSRTVSAPAGLQWITTNPGVVSISTDDPPVLTGIAAGSATVYAGVVPISVTVYAGSFPPGTVLWSFPMGGGALPAVPSSSGADVFVTTGQNLFALKSDGTIAWQTPMTHTLIPDFSGNAYTTWSQGCPTAGGSSHAVGKLDPVTHQESLLYTFSCDYQDPFWEISGGGPYYTDRLGTESVVPDTLGNVFIQDVDKVVLFNSSGQQVASIPLELSNIYCPSYDFYEALPACSQGQLLTEPPAAGQMIVAGDGNAYVPYVYFNDQSGNGGMIVLRVSPDGSYSKIPISAYPFYLADVVADDIYRGPSSPSPLSVITNADQGAAVVSPAPPGANQYGQLTYVSANAISGQTALPFLASGAGSTTFWPQLQREDGSYVGTIGEYCPGGSSLSGSCGPLNNENGQTVAAVGASGVVWQQQFASPVLPLYATSDGGATVTSTQLADNQRQLGTLYTLDPNGNVTSQSADTGAVLSWTGNWYVDPPETVSQVSMAPMSLAASFWPILNANESQTSAGVIRETLYLRSFAPWPWFGPEPAPPCAYDCFRGDNRSFSTSVFGVTSRVTGGVRFALPGMVLISTIKPYSDPSYDVWGRTAIGRPTMNVTANGNGTIHIELAGSNPLVPLLAPDIDTKLDITGQLESTQACYSGHLYGDAFPNSEVFVINSSEQAIMLLTFATSYDRNVGPFTLYGNNNRAMGSFVNTCTGN